MPKRTRRSRSRRRATGCNPVVTLVGTFLFISVVASRLLADGALPWLIAGGVVSISLVVLLIWGVSQTLRQHRRMRLLQTEAYALSPTAFEEYVALVLADLGWEQVRRSGGSGDRGVDIHAIYDGQRYIVQCKRYKNQVTPAMVRELVGTLHIQQADRALLVTTSSFSAQGYAEAANDAVELWDGPMLAQRSQEAAARRQDPTMRQRARRRTWRILAGGIVANSLVLLWAVSVPSVTNWPASGHLPDPPRNVAAPQITITLPRPVTPTRSTTPVATEKPDTPVPSEPSPPAFMATVFNGGNVRAVPDLQGLVLDQIHAHEPVRLLAVSPDAQWYRIITARDVTGWVHVTLLTLDPTVAARVPVVMP